MKKNASTLQNKQKNRYNFFMLKKIINFAHFFNAMDKNRSSIFCKDKVGTLLEYVCYQIPQMHLRKLLKIIYLIDEESVKLRAIPITWLDYYAWKKGPVAPDIYSISEGDWANFVTKTIGHDGRIYVSSKKENPYLIDKDMNVFSEYEKEIIDRVIVLCKDKTADELTDETHQKDSLWYQVVKKNHITFEKDDQSTFPVILNDLNNKENKEVYLEAFDCMMMQAALNSSCYV